MPATTSGGNAPFKPEGIGTGSGSRSLRSDQGKTFALLIMAGAVNIDEVIDNFFDKINSLLEDQLTALPKKRRGPTK